MAPWSPMASAASTPAAAASGTAMLMRSRRYWRSRSTGWPASSASFCARSPGRERTYPVARRPCSNSHSSVSKACGLAAPCGCRSRAVRRHRWPARRSSGPSSKASASGPRYQPSDSCAGTTTGRPCQVADSTLNTNRVPVRLDCGSRATTPTSCTSWPSSSAGRASASKRSALQAVLPAANSAAARAPSSKPRRPGQRTTATNNTVAATSSSACTPAGHTCACCSCTHTPSSPASGHTATRTTRLPSPATRLADAVHPV